MVKVLIPLAQGCEELEAVTLIDLLRRGGIQVVTAGLDEQVVTASRGTRLLPDTSLDKVFQQEFDMVVLPGGQPGADNLNGDRRIRALLKRTAERGKITAAICAAPTVLASTGLLASKRATGYPGFLDKLDLPTTTLEDQAVVVDGCVVTSKGPGTAMDFALTLIELLVGGGTRNEVEETLQRPA
ncbi:DJ-1 protein [Nitrosococcus oceani ATCC 19707]|uniref:DJ-1 protein n=2 Tax=Nitrosococcus oceani TaxID=1229 RepID=Q3JF25_NITOC|nr:DJ-1 family glyoxalase III [Nitrosococcus oceani]ABA56571.1 DJ-1 protein [Nitrosococcus oceani ATCC 19707]EDZ65529.1 DJ-1 family protein [Nitrosococcus oceani AFC27]KFI20997.1 4-methyl-5(B-hydroxyethyl)-thiazole monophosphate biosynthesis protein [Nitrosococcus oceani C-27]GEM21597.1 4-methyl-5(B-hydroxyethyl)-thiazole monophosphate biosynthesis protein [Nitrosococcus oceani]